MRLLVHMSLSDRKVRDMLLPLSKIDEVTAIDVVRYRPGPRIDKVTYVCPPEGGRWRMYLGRIRLLKQRLNEQRYDFVIAYLFTPHGIVALREAKKAGVPAILSIIAGPIEFLSLVLSQRRIRYAQKLPRWTISKAIMIPLIKQFHRVTVTGTFTKSVLVDSGVDESKVVVLRNPVDTNSFSFRPTEKEFDVLVLSRFAWVKNLETAMKAVGLVAMQLPDVRVACVGRGLDAGVLRAIALDAGLADNVAYFDHTSAPESFYRRSRLFLLSSFREGFPSTILESLACGTPVVTSKCGDVTDFVVDGRNGFVISDADDYGAYAKAILRVLSDGELEKRLSANAPSIVDQCSIDGAMRTWKGVLGIT